MFTQKLYFKIKKNFLNVFLKRFIIIIFDLNLCVFSLWLAFFLRMDRFYYINEIPLYPLFSSLVILSLVILSFGIHKSINRYSGLETFIELSKAMLIYSLVFFCLFTLNSFDDVPRTIGIIQPILLSFGILSSRALIRYIFLKLTNKSILKMNSTICLIYGAGASGRQLADVINTDDTIDFVGFLDDNLNLKGTKINNRTIYHPSELSILKKKKNIQLVLLAMPKLHIHQKTKILANVQFLNIAVRTIPDLNQLTSGKIDISNVRSLNIDDLLGRVPVDIKSLSPNTNIKNKTIIITGGGGSIGSEICRQISQLSPKIIIIIELNEFSLYSIQQEIETKFSNLNLKIIPKLISILDENNLEKIFKQYKPNTVFHAAAYKHVKIVEDNPFAGIENNVFGTLILAKLSLKYKVSNFLLISTDKAVRSSNIMGASKRLAELIAQAFEKKVGITKFSMVRFGNVLGSSGSVVPKFMEQIKSGGPITLTHEKVTRFFMTINEAVSLVIKSSIIAKGGEVFVLNMGDPVRIIDLAKQMIELSGKTIKNKDNINGDIEIKIVGLSKGEKLYEELLIGNNPIETQEQKILMAQEIYIQWAILEKYLKDLKIALEQNNLKIIYKLLTKIGVLYQI